MRCLQGGLQGVSRRMRLTKTPGAAWQGYTLSSRRTARAVFFRSVYSFRLLPRDRQAYLQRFSENRPVYT